LSDIFLHISMKISYSVSLVSELVDDPAVEVGVQCTTV